MAVISLRQFQFKNPSLGKSQSGSPENRTQRNAVISRIWATSPRLPAKSGNSESNRDPPAPEAGVLPTAPLPESQNKFLQPLVPAIPTRSKDLVASARYHFDCRRPARQQQPVWELNPSRRLERAVSCTARRTGQENVSFSASSMLTSDAPRFDVFWTPRGLHTSVLNSSSPSPLLLMSPSPNSRLSCSESSGFGSRIPSNTLTELGWFTALGCRSPTPFRAARTPCGVRCRHFGSTARTACCRSRGIGNFPDTSIFKCRTACAVMARSTITALNPWSFGQRSTGGAVALALSYLVASRSHAVIHRLYRQDARRINAVTWSAFRLSLWREPTTHAGANRFRVRATSRTCLFVSCQRSTARWERTKGRTPKRT